MNFTVSTPYFVKYIVYGTRRKCAITGPSTSAHFPPGQLVTDANGIGHTYFWFGQALFKIKTYFNVMHIFLTRHSRKLKLTLFQVKPGHGLKPCPSVSSHPPLYRDCCALAWWSIKTSVSKHLHISFSKKVFFFFFLTQTSCFFHNQFNRIINGFSAGESAAVRLLTDL